LRNIEDFYIVRKIKIKKVKWEKWYYIHLKIILRESICSYFIPVEKVGGEKITRNIVIVTEEKKKKKKRLRIVMNFASVRPCGVCSRSA